VRLYIAGIKGMVGSSLASEARSLGFEVLGKTSANLDLRDRNATFAELRETKPEVLIIAAAVVGGIVANLENPVDFLSDNLQIQTNLIDAAYSAKVEKLVFLGSSCIYPKFANQPITESSLLTGPLEITNESYAVAKIAGIKLVQAYRKQYDCDWIIVNPCNLYGPGDNFDHRNSHVLPALLRKFHEAKKQNLAEIRIWGDGTPIREFLHVNDHARGIFEILGKYNELEPINIGTGSGISIRKLATMISNVVGFNGEIKFDTSYPNGTPEKVLDISKIIDLGWRANIELLEGIKETYEWYLRNEPNLNEVSK
jgi:GDP-L-fucose synthase